MGFYLLQTKLNGIKNISKEIRIDYYNSVLKKQLDIKKNHIKAIYGPNGAGKTGVVYAMRIYKNLVLNPSYLTVVNTSGALKEIINQNTKEFNIENIFVAKSDNDVIEKVYKHSFCVSLIDNHFEIVNEKLECLSGYNINSSDKYHIIYKVENGKISDYSNEIKDIESISNNTKNLLSNMSLLGALFESKTLSSIDDSLGKHLINLVLFCLDITIVLQNEDKPFIDFTRLNSMINQLGKAQNEIKDAKLFTQLMNENRILDNNYKKVLKKDYNQYEKLINNLSSFIKVFNEDFEGIIIKKYDNKCKPV